MIDIKTKEFIKRDAIVVDVRSEAEFAGGHVTDSLNIPLETVANNIEKLKEMNKPIIACCASGMRSDLATQMLNKNGLEAINGGPWMVVQGFM
jgi:rhodanese-related sulfurtransferase